MHIRYARLVVAGLILHLGAGLAIAQQDETERLENATTVFEEIMDAPDSAVPRAILDKAAAVAIIPNTVKAGFVFGAHRGKGVLSARNDQGDLFAGITLKGSTIRADRDANERFYGYPYGSGQLVLEEESATPYDAGAVAAWRTTLGEEFPDHVAP